jgi:hypothetical protein
MKYKLATDLEAKFLKVLPKDDEGHNWFQSEGVTLAEADGIRFLCPKCFETNHGPVGTHSVICWFAGKVDGELDPKPGRWNPGGTGLDDLTFVPPGAVSVQLMGGCNWHGFVANGEAG